MIGMIFGRISRGGRAMLLAAVIGFIAMLASIAPAQDSPAAGAAADVTFDRWYVLLLTGERAGWSHVTVSRDAGMCVTASTTRLSIRRGAMAMDVGLSTRFVETDDGQPIEAQVIQDLGAMRVTQTMRFGADGIELVSSQAGPSGPLGPEQRQVFPRPSQKWLTPLGAERYVEQELEAGAKRIAFYALDPSLGAEPFEITINVQGEQTVEVFGKDVPAVVAMVETSKIPGIVMQEYVDQRGRPIKTTVQVMSGLELTMLQADQVVAMAEVDPPELLAATLVKPDRPITSPRSLRSALYEIHVQPDAASGDAIPMQAPRSGYQRSVWGDDQTMRVAVDLDEPVNPVDDLPTEAHLRASIALNCDDPEIQRLVQRALADADRGLPVAERAERLRQFVNRHMQRRDLSVGFATASEVARTARGDCTEHAVLLAAMLRGAGIASRTVTGVVYVDAFLGHEAVFGYHMWTQAWLEDGGGRWVDLDATLDQHPFDAGHIALATSALQDGQVINDMVHMARWIGRMSIRVIEPVEDRQ